MSSLTEKSSRPNPYSREACPTLSRFSLGAAVVTDITGVSARSMLQALVEGEEDVQVLVSHAIGRLIKKREQLKKALQGQVRDHHRFLISQHLSHLDFLEEQIGIFNIQIQQSIERHSLSNDDSTAKDSSRDINCEENSETSLTTLDWQQAVELLDSIPGVARQTAELLIAEIGCDMSRFKSAAHER